MRHEVVPAAWSVYNHPMSSIEDPAADEIARLFAAAMEQAGILPADLMTIRDLLEISGYEHEPSLRVLLLILFLALAEGSLCVEVCPESLRRRLAGLADDRRLDLWAGSIVADIERFPKLIGSSEEDKPVLLLVRGERRYLYFHKFLRSELAFRECLRSRLQDRPPSEHAWRPILHEVLHERPLHAGERALKLDRDQLLALGLGLTKNFVIVSGGPGTGKTSLVLTLLRCLVRSGLRPDQFALAAPTGRAAQRLVDALRSGIDRLGDRADSFDRSLQQMQARTLHQLLEYHSKLGIFRRHEENPLAQQVVIVDEVSMVGVVLMATLFRALSPGTKLILLGDKDQLPSVDAGAILSSLIPPGPVNRFRKDAWLSLERTLPPGAVEQQVGAWPDHVVMLQVNHRSQKQIRETAQAINDQAADLVERLPAASLPLGDAAGCYFMESSSTQPAEIRRILQRWADEQFSTSFLRDLRRCDLKPGGEEDSRGPLEALFASMEASRVLTLVREGPWGSIGINDFLDRHLRPTFARQSRSALFPGAPVLITNNDHARELFNGDVGLTVPSGNNHRVAFRRGNGFVSFAPESLPAHELGFALTVHKSQGSEYDKVLVVLPPTSGRRLLTKEILYTAVTRARKLAVLCGSREVLQLAVSRRIERESAFSSNDE